MVVYIILGIAAVVMAVVGYLFGSKSQTEIIKTLTSERDVQKAYADNYKASLETETERNRQKEAELKESFDRQLADFKDSYDKQITELKNSHDKQIAELKDSHDKQLAQTKDNADKRNIFEKAFTIGFVMSLANPHRAKHDVISTNGKT